MTTPPYFQQAWLHAILDTSLDGIALLDDAGRLIEANASLAHFLQTEPSQITGKTLSELLLSGNKHDAFPAPELARLQQALQAHQPVSALRLELSRQGQRCMLVASLTPVQAADHRLALLRVRDVTAEEETVSLKASALSMIAHELRAPLNTVNGFLDLTLAGVGGELNDQQREFIQRARAGSEQLYTLLENLLLTTRADARQFHLNLGVVNLAQVIKQAVDELELTASDSEIRLEVVGPDPALCLYADGLRLQQVLRNLIGNALRCTDRGGQIVISAWTEEGEPLSADESSQVACLQVQDNGIGIASEYHQQIFERFFQVPVSHHGRPGSQGLGLAIVKLIVEGHGGSIELISSPGEGSIFTCRLPGVLS